MKVKWSGIGVTEGRGKINGSVASKNRGGAYFRVKVSPTNPDSIAQQSVRNTLTTLSQAWRGLTQAQRDAWDAAVSDFAVTDVFGDLRNPTGKNLYVRLNANLVSVGQSTISVPPALADVVGVAVTGVTINVTTPAYEIAFSGDDASMSYQVWATPAVSNGVSYVKNRFRQIGAFAGGGGSPYNFEADYIAKFGSPAAGQKVFVQLVPVVNATGQKGIASSAFTQVAS